MSRDGCWQTRNAGYTSADQAYPPGAPMRPGSLCLPQQLRSWRSRARRGHRTPMSSTRCTRSRCSKSSIWAIHCNAAPSLRHPARSRSTGAAKKGAIDVTIDTTVGEDHRSPARYARPRRGFFNAAQTSDDELKSRALSFDGDRVVGADGEPTLLGVTKPVKADGRQFCLRRSSLQQETDVRRRSDRGPSSALDWE